MNLHALRKRRPDLLGLRAILAHRWGRLYALAGIFSFSMRYRGKYRIPSARLPGWDYRWAGVYGVTVCVRHRVQCLGRISEARALLSSTGELVEEEWKRIPFIRSWISLDEFVIMPDHLHGILVFREPPIVSSSGDLPASRLASGSLGAVVGQFKSNCTKAIWRGGYRSFGWQERFHEQIVRNERHLAQLRSYIRDNPMRWEQKQRERVETSPALCDDASESD
jgi:putative transposase